MAKINNKKTRKHKQPSQSANNSETLLLYAIKNYIINGSGGVRAILNENPKLAFAEITCSADEKSKFETFFRKAAAESKPELLIEFLQKKAVPEAEDFKALINSLNTDNFILMLKYADSFDELVVNDIAAEINTLQGNMQAINGSNSSNPALKQSIDKLVYMLKALIVAGYEVSKIPVTDTTITKELEEIASATAAINKLRSETNIERFNDKCRQLEIDSKHMRECIRLAFNTQAMVPNSNTFERYAHPNSNKALYTFVTQLIQALSINGQVVKLQFLSPKQTYVMDSTIFVNASSIKTGPPIFNGGKVPEQQPTDDNTTTKPNIKESTTVNTNEEKAPEQQSAEAPASSSWFPWLNFGQSTTQSSTAEAAQAGKKTDTMQQPSTAEPATESSSSFLNWLTLGYFGSAPTADTKPDLPADTNPNQPETAIPSNNNAGQNKVPASNMAGKDANSMNATPQHESKEEGVGAGM